MEKKKFKNGVILGDNVQKIFEFAKKNQFAIPAINCVGIDYINSILEASAKLKLPIIIQFSYRGAAFIAGEGLLKKRKTTEAAILGAVSAAKYVHKMAKYYGANVMLHTDHCYKEILPWLDGLLYENEKFFHINKKPLFSSHMIDLSKETIENNIKICSKYLKRMKKINLTLEIELGCTGGEEDGINNNNLTSSNFYTKPEIVSYVYEKLKIISKNLTIAAAFGNVHGVYKTGNVKLKPTILRDTQKYISNKFNLPKNNINFVFHGGSGSLNKDIKESIKYGVVKINIDTDIQWANWFGILKYYKKNKNFLQTQLGNPKGINNPNKNYYDPRKIIRAGQKNIILYLKNFYEKQKF
ncbi:class II fructose-bisphosphate aldolase [Enterobacteriaceae bacterium ET-AT1-13]|nr:class II fructose-bisphosphate aldolase [Enterobacteriaceae bacterium ET-AT1-13]WGS66358.1 class II fructose-bisphosphate aldolase [Enterobacteriaceae bacterium Cmel17]WMC17383.1 MAG: class II fructose-bisphosphate aldolase [Enterobacteriaceae bacterium Cmel21]WMC17589.1 MAG: class II fructose-bisphosphate aldolase [Enterobacteriaceae bacterium PSmelAO3-2]WMC17794.1 MAG: class II fructose-bisphosphate aldolase [Enterobacteriaceae bacterium PSmelAO3-1]WMC17997.1 MAG: class II fructose-bispho